MTGTDSPALGQASTGEFRRRNSLEWRLIAPVPIVVLLAVATTWIVMPRVVAQNSTNDAIRSGVQIAEQFKTIRGYYTQNVVGKVAKSGALRPGIDHASNEKMIPLPATMIHDLSALLAKKDTTVNLYSAYPFPNRKGRQLDNFQQEAWKFLNANPTSTFSRNEIRNGRPVARVAVADTMTVEACVNCHNTDSASPKKDWKIGQVRGVLEVTSAIDAQLAAGAALSNSIIIGAILIGAILLGIVIWAARSVTRPLTGMVQTMGELARGRNDVEVPGANRKDELGLMARAVLVFRDAAVEKERLESVAEENRRAADEERGRNADAQAKAEREQAEAQARIAEERAAAQTKAAEEQARVAKEQARLAEEQAQVVRALAEGLGAISSGNLTFRLDDDFTDAYRQIKDDFNATISRLHETIQTISLATREVANTTGEISASTTDLSQRTEEQAASLEQTTSSMEQISQTVRKNAESAQQASDVASNTRGVADRGGEVVAQAVGAMARIEESSRKIADIIGVIDEIARQTNLLALNAAVEAARAGDAGRGFAVVASEVRSLAQRSSQAAKDIKELITNSSGQVQEGVDLVNRAGASLSEIVGSIKQVADIVSAIASASAEQSSGIEQVNTALSQMDRMTQQNSALVEQNAAAAKSLEQQSQDMAERVRFFQVGGEGGAVPVARARNGGRSIAA
ncbi:MAG: DUF3365 domain-containing protein [Alphaproteobacteria bacterium]|nr:DUF3365 domain-containing protein [Alphaproteobacteria bacterium]